MASSDSADLNNVPEQARLPKLSRRAIILGLVVAGFATFFFPLNLISDNIRT